MINLPAIFESLVANVATKLGEPVYFDCGSRKEIVAHLDQKTKGIASKDERFPLIWMVFPFTKDFRVIGEDFKVPDLAFYIANLTKRDSSTKQRMVDNFLAVLYPIYEEFINQIESSGYFFWEDDHIPHQLIDWPFWGEPEGKQDAIPLNDVVDAVLIKGLNLIVNTELCQSRPFKLLG